MLPLLLASTTAAKSTYWKEVEAKKRRPAAAAYCPKRCFTTEASGDERREAADLTCCSSAQGTIFELAAFVAATTETAVRGFSLGFGYVLVKATLRAADSDEGPRSGHDFGPAYRFARMAGLGRRLLVRRPFHVRAGGPEAGPPAGLGRVFRLSSPSSRLTKFVEF